MIPFRIKSNLVYKNIFLTLQSKAIHNKDYSVVKTFSASTIFGAFLLTIRNLEHFYPEFFLKSKYCL